jgi:nucleotide-binding universal stress UspA family protein
MSIFHRILVPVDGSPPADGAVTLALRLADDHAAEITFCSIVNSNSVASESAFVGADPTPIVEALEADGARLVAEATEKARAAGVASKTQVSHADSPVEGILGVALSHKADLIVMGSHGWSGLSRLVLGSTTEGVLRQSLVPVLVVREVAGA